MAHTVHDFSVSNSYKNIYENQAPSKQYLDLNW